MSQSYETFGKYILLERLAMGGMAEIYLARSLASAGVSKFFAIKRILPQFSEQVEFIDMFKDEAKIAVNLSHANIVSIFEFGMEKSAFYLAMDYVEGSNLRQIINKMKKSGVTFSIEQVIYIIKEVAAGLDAAHRCIDAQTGKPLNIIHRDMSPQNVMVSYEGEVKVVDFGIAKAETQIESTRAGTLKGKFGYMSPEQAEGQQIDLRTDIFALGIVFWELLANDRLFVANNEVNTLRKIRDCQIPSLRKINPNIPQELERIVGKALAKDRNLRYQTGAAFQRDLSKFLNRQYPDFSPHDFSVFVKTLFAGEILERRKKMIEYAKVDTKMIASPTSNASSPVTTPDQTIVTSTHSVTENTDGRGTPDLGTAEPRATAKERNESRNEKPRPTLAPPPPPRPMANTPHPGPSPRVRDLAAAPEVSLSVDRSSYRDRNFGETSGLYSGTRSDYTRSSIQVQQKSSVSFPFILIILGLLAGSGAYYYTNPDKVIEFAQKVSPEVAKILVRYNQTTSSSVSNTARPVSGLEVSSKVMIPISSQPAGARIIINGRTHSDVTPTTVQLDEGANVKVVLHIDGYEDLSEEFKVNGPRHVFGTLHSRKLGKLFVNVVGAGKIFVNGRAVTPVPGEPIPVPVDRELLVSVYDAGTKTGDETHVLVSEGRVQKITLIPRANYRFRGGSPEK